MNADLKTQFLLDINQNIRIVHRVCNIYISGDKEEREDVFQEIMYQLWKSYSSFNGESKFSTWMYKVALNIAITHVKRTRRKSQNERLSDKHNLIADGNEEVNKEEKINLLYSAIRTLSEIDKAIILLYLEDNSYYDIAAVTGLTKTNVSVRLVRIKRALKEKLEHSI